jgi:hypothetical protein
MTAKHHRILGFAFCALAVTIALLNLQRTANLGLKSLPVVLIVLGALQFNRARRKEQQTS